MTEINCDMGEGFGLYRMGDDAALMPLISAANVACGFHGSDFNHMRATGQQQCTAVNADASVTSAPLLGLTSGYVQRSAARFPKHEELQRPTLSVSSCGQRSTRRSGQRRLCACRHRSAR